MDEQLIYLVQQNDLLYNKYKTAYKMPEMKAAAWSEIARKIGLSDEECIKRWTGLRDRFTKELRRLETAATGKYESPWHFFESMMFLKNFVRHRKRTRKNMYDDETTSHSTYKNEDTMFIMEAGETVDELPGPSKQRKAVPQREVDIDLKEFFKDLSAQKSSKQPETDPLEPRRTSLPQQQPASTQHTANDNNLKELVALLKEFISTQMKSKPVAADDSDDSEIKYLLKAVQVKIMRWEDVEFKKIAIYEMLNYLNAMEDYINAKSSSMPKFQL